MRRIFLITLAAITAFSMISCTKDNTLRYNNATMVNMSEDGSMISDQGNRFHIVDATCNTNFEDITRAFIICDVLKSNGKNKGYDIRLNHMVRVLEKDAVEMPVGETSIYKDDPLILNDVWFSGGYINILMTAPWKVQGNNLTEEQKKEQAHIINLLYEKGEDGYRFRISQDAKGDIYSASGGSILTWAYSYASFPISSIITEDNAKVSIEWNSYIPTPGPAPTAGDTKQETYELNYTKGDFTQTPNPAAPAPVPEAVAMDLQ